MKSLAGQKGQESIGTVLGTTNFIRFRLGVGKPLSGSTTTIPQWVLGPFSQDNKEMVNDLLFVILHDTPHYQLHFVKRTFASITYVYVYIVFLHLVCRTSLRG